MIGNLGIFCSNIANIANTGDVIIIDHNAIIQKIVHGISKTVLLALTGSPYISCQAVLT